MREISIIIPKKGYEWLTHQILLQMYLKELGLWADCKVRESAQNITYTMNVTEEQDTLIFNKTKEIIS